MPYIFLKLVWKTNPIHSALRVIQLGFDSYSEIPIKVGDEFHMKVAEEKFCIGSEINIGEWNTCATNQKRLSINTESIKKEYTDNPVTTPSIQCSNCKISDYFSCRMTCVGKFCSPTSILAKLKCEPPKTFVYITHVGGELKIGVSLGIPRRWLEQASDYAAIVAIAPGLEARKIEHQSAKKLNLKLQVRNTRKLRNITPVSFEIGKEELKHKIREFQNIMDQETANSKIEIIKNPEIVNLTHNYGKLTFNRKIDIMDPQSGIEFGGKIVTIKGSIIIAKNDNYYYAMDTKKLTASIFKLLDRPAKMAREQSSLDDWF